MNVVFLAQGLLDRRGVERGTSCRFFFQTLNKETSFGMERDVCLRGRLGNGGRGADVGVGVINRDLGIGLARGCDRRLLPRILLVDHSEPAKTMLEGQFGCAEHGEVLGSLRRGVVVALEYHANAVRGGPSLGVSARLPGTLVAARTADEEQGSQKCRPNFYGLRKGGAHLALVFYYERRQHRLT